MNYIKIIYKEENNEVTLNEIYNYIENQEYGRYSVKKERCSSA